MRSTLHNYLSCLLFLALTLSVKKCHCRYLLFHYSFFLPGLTGGFAGRPVLIASRCQGACVRSGVMYSYRFRLRLMLTTPHLIKDLSLRPEQTPLQWLCLFVIPLLLWRQPLKYFPHWLRMYRRILKPSYYFIEMIL